MNLSDRIFIAGSDTLAGRAITEELQTRGFRQLLLSHRIPVDLCDARSVRDFFSTQRPDFVFLVGGRSGGIGLNRREPAGLMLDNLQIVTHVLGQAARFGVRKLLYLASSCIYPLDCPQPMKPDALFTGPLEPISEPYAMAKLAGVVLCRACRRQWGSPFIVGIPATPFGPGDHFDPENAHVVGALLVKIHEAKQAGRNRVTLWGTGRPRRDFIYTRDLARACLWLMEHYDGEMPMNLTAPPPLSIAELAEVVRRVVGFQGTIEFDPSQPDGAPVKCLDGTALAGTGWQPAFSFEEGLQSTYQAFLRSESTRS